MIDFGRSDGLYLVFADWLDNNQQFRTRVARRNQRRRDLLIMLVDDERMANDFDGVLVTVLQDLRHIACRQALPEVPGINKEQGLLFP